MASDSNEVKIRRMTDADLPRVNEIDQLLYGENRLPTWPFSFEAYWGVHHPRLSFVAEVKGEVVGFFVGDVIQEEHSQSIYRLHRTLGPQPRSQKVGWIDMIGILPAFQGRQIGKKLFAAFEEQCSRNNATVRGVVREGDERLEKFMLSLGLKKWDLTTYEKE